jgi:hypothetical protein
MRRLTLAIAAALVILCSGVGPPMRAQAQVLEPAYPVAVPCQPALPNWYPRASNYPGGWEVVVLPPCVPLYAGSYYYGYPYGYPYRVAPTVRYRAPAEYPIHRRPCDRRSARFC